jgi:hypothetical protein
VLADVVEKEKAGPERGLADLGVPHEVSELRAVNGPNYGRVWDADIVDLLVDRFGDGINVQWRVPGEFGQRVTVTKKNTTLYASDRDSYLSRAAAGRSLTNVLSSAFSMSLAADAAGEAPGWLVCA